MPWKRGDGKQKCFHLVKFSGLPARRTGWTSVLVCFPLPSGFPFQLSFRCSFSPDLFCTFCFPFSIPFFRLFSLSFYILRGISAWNERISGVWHGGYRMVRVHREVPVSARRGAAVPPSTWHPTGGAGRSDLPLPDRPGSAGFHPEAAGSGGRYVMDRPGAA